MDYTSKYHNVNLLLPLLAFFLIGLGWAAISSYSGVSAQVFPGPIKVAVAMFELIASGALLKHAVASLFRVTVGFYLAILLGIPLGIIMGRSKILDLFINPVVQFLRPISPLAWIPLAMLWFGIGDKPAIFLIFLSSFFPMLVSTSIAVNSINSIYFQVAANFNFSKAEVVKKIILPAIIPEIITTLRLTITIAWLVVVAAEMIAVQSGLGYLILDSRNALRMDYVMVGMVAIGIIGLLLDTGMRRLGMIETAAWGIHGR